MPVRTYKYIMECNSVHGKEKSHAPHAEIHDSDQKADRTGHHRPSLRPPRLFPVPDGRGYPAGHPLRKSRHRGDDGRHGGQPHCGYGAVSFALPGAGAGLPLLLYPWKPRAGPGKGALSQAPSGHRQHRRVGVGQPPPVSLRARPEYGHLRADDSPLLLQKHSDRAAVSSSAHGIRSHKGAGALPGAAVHAASLPQPAAVSRLRRMGRGFNALRPHPRRHREAPGIRGPAVPGGHLFPRLRRRTLRDRRPPSGGQPRSRQ